MYEVVFVCVCVCVCVCHLALQFENAKRTFLEKHPLAKDRHMAGLLKADPFKGMSE